MAYRAMALYPYGLYSYDLVIVIACRVLAYRVMVCIIMADILMAYIVMACICAAYIGMACTIMAYIDVYRHVHRQTCMQTCV